MNTKQKILTGVAIVAFFLSVLCAPWEDIDSVESFGQHARLTDYRPIWAVDGLYNEHQLLWGPLAGTWVAIGIIYTGLFFLLKRTKSPGSKDSNPNNN
jgi:hypothetical protein